MGSHLTTVCSAILPGSNSQNHSIHLCPEWKHKRNHHHGCSQPLSGLEINQAVKHSNRLCDASSGTFIRFYKLIQLKQPLRSALGWSSDCVKALMIYSSVTGKRAHSKRHFVWMQILRLHCYDFHFSLLSLFLNVTWQTFFFFFTYFSLCRCSCPRQYLSSRAPPPPIYCNYVFLSLYYVSPVVLFQHMLCT